jgi:hypothetical protein
MGAEGTIRLKPDTTDDTSDVARGFSPAEGRKPFAALKGRATSVLVVLLAFTLSSSTAAQRDGQTLAPPTNLQVLSKNMSPQDVVATMQRFTQALGVQCTYCHVQAAPELLTPEQAAAAQAQGRGRGRGQGPPPMDFAADDKPPKHIARAMISLTNDINGRLSSRAGPAAPDGVRVQCVTCHRGVTIPRQLADMLSETMLTKGDGAAIALYRDLRQKYYGGQAYDFRESVLLSLAQQALAANKPDDALAFLRLNLEFYPGSVGSYLALADAHTRKRDRAAVRQDLEKALEFDPENTTVQGRLNALKEGR